MVNCLLQTSSRKLGHDMWQWKKIVQYFFTHLTFLTIVISLILRAACHFSMISFPSLSPSSFSSSFSLTGLNFASAPLFWFLSLYLIQENPGGRSSYLSICRVCVLTAGSRPRQMTTQSPTLQGNNCETTYIHYITHWVPVMQLERGCKIAFIVSVCASAFKIIERQPSNEND